MLSINPNRQKKTDFFDFYIFWPCSTPRGRPWSLMGGWKKKHKKHNRQWGHLSDHNWNWTKHWLAKQPSHTAWRSEQWSKLNKSAIADAKKSLHDGARLYVEALFISLSHAERLAGESPIFDDGAEEGVLGDGGAEEANIAFFGCKEKGSAFHTKQHINDTTNKTNMSTLLRTLQTPSPPNNINHAFEEHFDVVCQTSAGFIIE